MFFFSLQPPYCPPREGIHVCSFVDKIWCVTPPPPPHSPFMATSPLLIFSCFSQRPPLFSIPFYSLPEIIRVNCQAARLFSTLTFHDIGKVGGGGLLKLWISLLLEKRKKPITTFSEPKENRQEMTTIRTIVYPLLFSQLRAKNSCYLVVISFRQFSFLSSRVQ